MKYAFSLVICFIFSLLMYCNAYAAATPSDAEIASPSSALSDRPDFYLDDVEGMNRDELLQRILVEVISISDSMSGPGVATASQALPDDSLEISSFDIDGYEGETTGFDDVALPYALGNTENFVNVLRFDVSFNGTDYVLLFPPEYIDSLFIDSKNRLWNMSASNIQGRAVSDNFNPYETRGQLFYLTPCLGNNFSTLENYGSPNYMRNYYWSGGRLTYDTSYGEIIVNKYYHPFYVSQTLQYIILFTTLGGVLILWLRNYKKY